MDFTETYSDMVTSVAAAACAGNADVLRSLLSSGRLVNSHDNRGWFPLHEAVSGGHIECTRILLQHPDVQVDAAVFESITALHMAASHTGEKSTELCRLLIDHGADVGAKTHTGSTPLHHACKHRAPMETVRLLITDETLFAVEELGGFLPHHEAAEHNAHQAMGALLEYGNGTTLLRADDKGEQTWQEWIDCHQSQIQKWRDSWGRTPGFVAAYAGAMETFDVLCRFNCEWMFHVPDSEGPTELIVAIAEQPDIQCLQRLLEIGVGVVRADSEGISHSPAIYRAIISRNFEAVRVLVASLGADDKVRLSASPNSSIFIAAIPNDGVDHRVITELMGAGIDPKVATKRLRHSEDGGAVSGRYLERTYLENAANLFLPTYNRVGALAFALLALRDDNFLDKVVNLLIERGVALNAEAVGDMPPLVALALRIHSDFGTGSPMRNVFVKLVNCGARINYRSAGNQSNFPDCVAAAQRLGNPVALSLLIPLTMTDPATLLSDMEQRPLPPSASQLMFLTFKAAVLALLSFTGDLDPRSTTITEQEFNAVTHVTVDDIRDHFTSRRTAPVTLKHLSRTIVFRSLCNKRNRRTSDTLIDPPSTSTQLSVQLPRVSQLPAQSSTQPQSSSPNNSSQSPIESPSQSPIDSLPVPQVLKDYLHFSDADHVRYVSLIAEIVRQFEIPVDDDDDD